MRGGIWEVAVTLTPVIPIPWLSVTLPFTTPDDWPKAGTAIIKATAEAASVTWNRSKLDLQNIWVFLRLTVSLTTVP